MEQLVEVGRSKIGVVENIEHLDPELDVSALRYFLDRNIFKQRHVEINQARADERIPAGIAESVGARAGDARISWIAGAGRYISVRDAL